MSLLIQRFILIVIISLMLLLGCGTKDTSSNIQYGACVTTTAQGVIETCYDDTASTVCDAQRSATSSSYTVTFYANQSRCQGRNDTIGGGTSTGGTSTGGTSTGGTSTGGTSRYTLRENLAVLRYYPSGGGSTIAGATITLFSDSNCRYMLDGNSYCTTTISNDNATCLMTHVSTSPTEHVYFNGGGWPGASGRVSQCVGLTMTETPSVQWAWSPVYY